MQSRLISWLLGPHALAIIAQAGAHVFAVDPRDRGVGRRLLLNGEYGETELQRLKAYVTNSSRVLVVGAHVGALTIPLARLSKEVIAVEPNPISNQLLRINLLLNGISHCTVLDVAASDTQGSLQMLLNTANSGGAKRVPKRLDPMYLYDRPPVAQVPCAPLDYVVHDHRFDLIVMDVEGSEFFALRGMQNILNKSRILAVEFLPHHLKNVSGVTVEQFLAPISPHFANLFIPSKAIAVARRDFLNTLEGLYNHNEGDEGIIFSK